MNFLFWITSEPFIVHYCIMAVQLKNSLESWGSP